MKRNLTTIYEALGCCAVFYRLTEKTLFKAFEGYCLAENTQQKRKAYTAFVA